jgi:hypothetical protein
VWVREVRDRLIIACLNGFVTLDVGVYSCGELRGFQTLDAMT